MNVVVERATEIGDRLELFVDQHLIGETDNVTQRLHCPERREVALTLDAPWENNTATYFTALQDGDTVRLYYRAGIPKGDTGTMVENASTGGIVESTDGGITFTRPNLGLIKWDGNTDNNLYHDGPTSGLVSPFIDTNPDCKPEERYKALAQTWLKLHVLASPDGLHWRSLKEGGVDLTGTFDSLNLAFYDPNINEYHSFTRYMDHLEPVYTSEDALGAKPKIVRGIQSARSSNFVDWAQPMPNVYHDDYGHMQFYINNTTLCPGAEHIYLSFPNRYMQTRKKIDDHPHSGVNDTVFMASRDGVHWTRHPEAWIRPGLDDKCWTDRNNFMAWGIVKTSEKEWSMYVQEHYRNPDGPTRLRRLSIRPHGFASMYAGFAGGTFTTKPLIFDGDELQLNYSTSAVGSIEIDVLDKYGRAIDDFGAIDMEPLYGDSLCETVRWNCGSDLSKLKGEPICLRFHLKDADVFAMKFAKATN
jgi:hypothetical protein